MKVVELNNALIEELEQKSAEALIAWAFENFGERAAIGTSFQLTGSVIIELAKRRRDNFRVFTVDTGRLHQETLDMVGKVEQRYGIKVERFTPDAAKVKDMVERFGEYLFFTDKVKQEYCCKVRKVEPNLRALASLNVWITGLRRDQSGFRQDVKKAEVVDQDGRKILKLAPLADWGLEKIDGFIKDNDLPVNELFAKGYDSIGCVICSTPLVVGEAPRSGRWRWQKSEDDKKECGIHISKQ
ncbi:Phosphoadenylyl-sulfate reductase [thioredoxin] / Adenylyl-sulfate reductase [thioredoxin] [hydrothermal vent metagenome]|uniref:Phosphoadenylyl-sulfate reductase [thioredoxin] / Adenylyl-sulfate reductase [thioredoxin] n=1 Tax=hydrothermal vent metagenome TaxID=652676 RepID=A0A3B0R8Z7_9ZZZZ